MHIEKKSMACIYHSLYCFRFALPVYDDYDEVERYNVFHASMLVRHSNDGKMYLYDVIDIKKETSNSLGD